MGHQCTWPLLDQADPDDLGAVAILDPRAGFSTCVWTQLPKKLSGQDRWAGARTPSSDTHLRMSMQSTGPVSLLTSRESRSHSGGGTVMSLVSFVIFILFYLGDPWFKHKMVLRIEPETPELQLCKSFAQP